MTSHSEKFIGEKAEKTGQRKPEERHDKLKHLKKSYKPRIKYLGRESGRRVYRGVGTAYRSAQKYKVRFYKRKRGKKIKHKRKWLKKIKLI